jgi:hypothetical protein
MTASERNSSPDFFEDPGLDPVRSATRRPPSVRSVPKRKAGFYLSEAILKRFNRRFHEMKLAGIPVENKSDLLEQALHFALNDLDAGEHSRLLKKFKTSRTAGI